MASERILVVDDEEDILEIIRFNLSRDGYRVTCVTSGEEALRVAKSSPPDLMVLDLLLPGMNGLEVCKTLKKDKNTEHIPIIFLTVLGDEIDRIIGLELEADDYLTKPFSPRELILRIKAVLRRLKPEKRSQPIWQEEGLRVDFSAHRTHVNSEEVPLTATEFKLLTTLIQNTGRVLTRDQLLDQVWGYTFSGYARTVDTHIRRLRQKLSLYSSWIETVHGIGYRFRKL